jgi:hypothetical protein
MIVLTQLGKALMHVILAIWHSKDPVKVIYLIHLAITRDVSLLKFLPRFDVSLLKFSPRFCHG